MAKGGEGLGRREGREDKVNSKGGNYYYKSN